ncbi:MAG: hypothetical protein IPK46_22660 [Saprospiraceae bacterium]|nr:hypothetical protein [Saprospiraceae bacterium]
MQGGFQAAWQVLQLMMQSQPHPYYLLFGRQKKIVKVTQEYGLKLALPSTGILGCLSDVNRAAIKI